MNPRDFHLSSQWPQDGAGLKSFTRNLYRYLAAQTT